MGELYLKSYKQKINLINLKEVVSFLNVKEQILDLYFNKHLKQKEIAKLVNTSNQYVSKIVRTDNRISTEKENRQKENRERRAKYLQNYFKTYVRPKYDDTTYKQLLELQKQDSIELSYYNNTISDYNFAKWNSSIYHTNKNGNLSLNRNTNVGLNIPKSINMNIKVPTQKYKNKYTFSN
jgi:transcriptional regulator with XRE-family HTH domain